jgi:hypothetical protein
MWRRRRVIGHRAVDRGAVVGTGVAAGCKRFDRCNAAGPCGDFVLADRGRFAG